MKNKVIPLVILSLIGFCSAKTYYPLTMDWSSPLKSDVIYPLDLDKDGMNELYVVSYMKHRSCIYFFDYDGNAMGRNCIPGYSNYMYPHANEEITLIYVDDLNYDRVLDVIAASNIVGTGVNVQKMYIIRREYIKGLNRYKYERKWDYTPGNLITDVKVIDIDKDWWVEIIAASLDSSVYVFGQDRRIKNRYNLGSGVWSISASDLDGDGGVEIVAGSLLGVSLLENGKIEWNYSTKERIFDVYTGDVDGDGNSEILALSEDEVYLLDKNGKLRWRKPMENLVDSWIKDVDNDGSVDILLLTKRKIYSLDKNGNTQWQYNFSDILLTISIDLNNHIFVGSLDKLYKFRINQDYFLNRYAERCYSQAYDYYLRGEYSQARFYAAKSKQLFSMVDNLEGALRCDFILLVTGSNTTVSKREKADEYYAKALELLDLKSYEDAKNHAEMALKIYREINDRNSVIKCDLLLVDIDKKREEAKRNQAMQCYTTAIELLSNNTFEEASTYALEALQIYRELNDSMGASNSESLIQKIKLRERIYFANYFYSLAIKSFDSDEYENATLYAEKAKNIYIELNDSEKVTECDSLIDILDRYTEAESYLDLAMERYRTSYLENATLYAEKAKNIYIELNDSEKVTECDFLLSEIEKMKRESLLNYVIGVAPIIFVIILIALLHRQKLKKEKWIREGPQDSAKSE